MIAMKVAVSKRIFLTVLLGQVLVLSVPASGLDVGQGCSGPSDTSCVSGAQCVDIGGGNYQCRLKVGETCTDTSNCTSYAKCVYVDGGSRQCRLKVGQTCTDTSNCTSNTECVNVDGGSRQCRLKVGQTCTDTSNCTSNTECVNIDGGSRQCRIAVGKKCTKDVSNQCVPGAECHGTSNDHQCRITAGSSVSCSNDNSCVTTAVCESNSCKTKVGQTCSGTSYTFCQSGSQCVNTGSNNHQCRITAGSSVSCSNDDINCVTTAVCESNRCKTKVGQTCSGTNYTSCQSGSQCVNTGSNNHQCRITAGSGVSCNSNNDKCVTTAVCESNRCKTKVGQTCSGTSFTFCQSGSQCVDTGSNNHQCRITAGSSASCSNDDNKCVTTAVCESNTCKTKVGQTCSGTSFTFCQSGSQCVDTGSNNHQCRKNYGVQCTSLDECQTSQRQTCVSLTSGKKCLCDGQSFRLGNKCENVAVLKATGLQMSGSDHQETTISVTWTPPQNIASVQYEAKLNTGQASSFSEATTYSFTGLTQGTSYTFYVTSRRLRNPDYDNTAYTTVKSDSASVYTKPAQPGTLRDDTLPGPNVIVTFTPSVGHVDTYRVTVTPQMGGAPWTVENSEARAMFVGLVPGQYYSVTIVAISNSITSLQRTASFRVQAHPAGMVTNLARVETNSRWVRLTWTKPVKPNGLISGYTVKLEGANISCFSGVAVQCSDCTYNSSQVTPTTSSCTHSALQTLTLAQMDSASFVVEVNVTQLMPDVWYQVDVESFNEEGPGYNDRHLSFTTKSEAAANLVDLTVSAVTKGQLSVTWTPGERRGQTSYTVTWKRETSLQSNTYTVIDSTLLQGYKNNSYTITGLLSYWHYEVTVSSNTTVGLAPDTTSIMKRTVESTPAKVESLQLRQKDDDATKVTMTFNCPAEQKRNGKLVQFRYNSTITASQGVGTPDRPAGTLIVIGTACGSFTQDLTVSAETSYNVSVYAVTDSGLTGEVSTETVTVEAKPPKFLKKPAAEVLTTTEKTETTFTLDIQLDILSAKQGKLNNAGLLVCRKTGTQRCLRDSSTPKQANYYMDPNRTPTWSQAQKAGDKLAFYRPTPNDWVDTYSQGGGRRRRSAGSRAERERRSTGVFQFTIGSDTTCADKPANVYCNGPLSTGQQYHVIVFSCTSGGCSESTEPIIVNTASEDSMPIGAIVGGVVAVIATIVIVILVVVFFLRCRKSGLRMNNDDHQYNRLQEMLHDCKSVSMILFPARMEALHHDSNRHFLQEYQELLTEVQKERYTTHVEELPVNHIKNRDHRVLPYDHTRVKLFSREEAGQDYINASYVTGLQSPCDYVATQTPLISTVLDFWKMVWEQRSSVIIMLSEQNQPRSEDYWPNGLNCPVRYGDLEVTLLSVSALPLYTRRQLTLRARDGAVAVTQYQLSDWEAASSRRPLIQVCDVVSALALSTAATAAPVIVHCSDGAARTCTFIALDILQRFVKDHALGEDMDVFTTILNILKCRPAMLQSEAQYMFIHDVVRVMVERKMHEGRNSENQYENTGFSHSSVYDTTYEYVDDNGHYQTLGDVKDKTTGI